MVLKEVMPPVMVLCTNISRKGADSVTVQKNEGSHWGPWEGTPTEAKSELALRVFSVSGEKPKV